MANLDLFETNFGRKLDRTDAKRKFDDDLIGKKGWDKSRFFKN